MLKDMLRVYGIRVTNKFRFTLFVISCIIAASYALNALIRLYCVYILWVQDLIA